MEVLLLIIVIVIAYFLYNTYKKPNIHTYHISDKDQVVDHSDVIREQIKGGSFVKPQNALLHIFNQMSSKDKVVLNGNCQTNIFTKDTMPSNKNEYIVDLLDIIIKHVKGIDNNQDYYLKDIDQAYIQIDKDDNKRYIVVAFIYDIKNYYTMKIAVDFVRAKNDDQLYVNSIGNEFSSNYDVLNRYDFSIFSHGYLKNYNMFEKDTRAILDENYKKYFRLIGINDSSLEYYLLRNTYKVNKANITKYDLDDYNKYYYPPGLPNPDSDAFCQKHTNDWSKDGVKFENPYAPKECVAHNNASRKMPNVPYEAPGVVTERVDVNKYGWLVQADRGNMIRASGYKY